MEIRIKIGLPEDPARRALALTIIVSVLLHVALLALLVWSRPLGTPILAKRGEPLMLDLAPERPEEKAPRGDPSKALTPEPPAPKAPEPPRPKVAQAPPAPPAPRVAPPPPRPAPEPPRAAPEPPKPVPPQETAKPEPLPEPPKEVARAAPPAEAPRPAAPAKPAEPAPPSSSAPSAEASRPAPPAAPQTALAPSRAGTPSGMWRGGGLNSGRGGVEGEPVPLDTPDPRYADYFRQLRLLIQSKMAYPHDAGRRGLEADVFVEFHITKAGRLEFIQQRRLNGEVVFAEASIIAVQLASPFPPVPDSVAKGTLAITGHFVWRIADDPIGLVKRFRN